MERKIVLNIIEQLRDVQNGNPWYDVSIEKKIESITEQQAFLRPLPEVHSVAELISHIVAWRRDVVRRLQGLDSQLMVESPENWKNNEILRADGWERLQSDLKESLEALVDLLNDMDDQYLERTKYQEKYSLKYLVQGILHHDLYHLGQIGITIKLLTTGK